MAARVYMEGVLERRVWHSTARRYAALGHSRHETEINGGEQPIAGDNNGLEIGLY